MHACIKKSLKVILFVYLGLYSLVWIISPTVVRHFLTDYLAEQQLVLSADTSIRYNPFLSHLSIRDLSITKPQQLDNEQEKVNKVLSLETLDLEVRLYQFILDEVFISEFIIDGLYVNISAQNDQLAVAGFSLTPQSNANDESTEAEPVATSEVADNETPATELPYKLVMPKLTLENSAIELFIEQASHQLKLKSFVVRDLGATLASQSLLLAIDSEVNQSKLALDIKADMDNGQGKVYLDLSLNQVKLTRFKHFLPEDISKLGGLFSYQAEHTLTLSDNGLAVELKDLKLALEEVVFAQDDLEINLAEQVLTSDAFNIDVNQEQVVTAQGNAELVLKQAKAFSSSEQQVIAQFEQLNVNNIAVVLEDKVNIARISDIKLADFFFSDNVENEMPALARFSLLDIENIQASEQGIAINDINLSGLAIDAELSKDKELVSLVDLPGEKTAPEQTPNEEAPQSADDEIAGENAAEDALGDESAAPSFAIKLGQFSLADDATIRFLDNSVSPVYQRSLIISTLTAGAFDNQQPELESLYTLIGKSEKYAHFNFSGIMKPFTQLPFYSLKGAFKEVSLPSISPYIKDALQYEIETGQLDLALDVALTGTALDGDANVLLRGIEFTAADDHEAGSIKDQTSVPFNVALGMLKDSDGNVDLSLPLSGDTSSPSFGLSGLMTLLVKQATMSAAKDYLMTTFVPYASVVSIAISAGEFALKVRFNDLEFPVGEVELQPEHQEFLAQFSALLKDKEDVQVKLCAIATAADINKTVGVELTDKADIKQLKEISAKRVHAFKDYMVEQENIESSRLLLCTPQIDSGEEAKPRISFAT